MKLLFRFSVMLLALLLPALAMAHDFEVDGIYYNINGNEAAVTFKGQYYYFATQEYSGSIVIPATVTYNGTTYPVTAIGKHAFYCSTGLTSIVIPNSVTFIDRYALAGCTGLTSIDIPNSVTAIGFMAFKDCRGLTSIDIPNSVTYIGNLAFFRCTGLTSIVIPNSVTEIDDNAFAGCARLISIVIPNSVTFIGYESFGGCTDLTDVYCYIADPSRVSSGYNDPCHWWYLYDGDDYSGRTLHVLQGTADAYQADERWYPYFGQIVEDIFLGDVNRDHEVNIADVNAAIDIILGGNDDTTAADVNGDGEINIADINAIIDIILSH